MKRETLRELHDKGLLKDDQFATLDLILSRKIFSVFYELRTLLYLGVMLFTTGIGILIYKNIGAFGHMLSIGALFILTVACFVYAFRKALPYSNGKLSPPNPYYDYVVLLGCLLLISVQGYLQFQFGVLTENLGSSTLLSALIFFYVAYRFDHLGVLSLAITALASFWSLSISPQKWYSNDFFSESNLHLTALFFGACLAAVAIVLDRKNVKRHFTFTHLHFASLIFLTGALAGIFINEQAYGIYFLLLLAGCGLAFYYARINRSFIFLLYAFLYGYIGITYFLGDTIMKDVEIWFLYFMASCGGFVYLIIYYRNYFKRAA